MKTRLSKTAWSCLERFPMGKLARLDQFPFPSPHQKIASVFNKGQRKAARILEEKGESAKRVSGFV